MIGRKIGLGLVGILLFCLLGCAGKPVSVKGQVSLDAQPIEQGSIVFLPTGVGPKLAATISSGTYEISADRLGKPGSYRVEIVWDKKTGKLLPSADPGGAPLEETKQVVPAQFNTQSTLSRDLKAGENVHDFALTSR